MTIKVKALALFGLAALCSPLFAADQARPGTLNYVEGSVSLADKPVTSKSIGSAELEPGQVLSTGQGKAELLLTPGVFLRLDDNSAVKMLSPDLTFTQLALERGRATVEVDEIYSQNDVQIVNGGVSTQLLKTGLYEFDANNKTAMVFKGKAAVHEDDNQWVVLKGHHELQLASGETTKPETFNTHAAQGELYDWSNLRSQYLSEENPQIAGQYAGAAGFAPGWYWDPFAFDYGFIGADPFWSPFGWGFYPPGYFGGMYGGGFYGGGMYGRGFYGRGMGYRGYAGRGVGGGGFHGGGGGFHGGGGGFHGGGGGHR
ncbi:MAG TPA: hypothetical protein VGR96_16770 [Acidobacteriaceae bacterium]|nr:hypothetical protein [Acidobacteriaceae bacterium]